MSDFSPVKPCPLLQCVFSMRLRRCNHSYHIIFQAPPSESGAVAFDGVSHHALGGGSYAFKEEYPQYLSRPPSGKGPKVEINLIIQPNNSPHFGTLFSMTLSFALARELQTQGLEPIVILDFWDNAKHEQVLLDGVTYQRGLRSTGRLSDIIQDYYEILVTLKERYQVDYLVRMEDEFLRQDGMPPVVRGIIHERMALGPSLSPSTSHIALRSACPVAGCGLVDKYGVHNVYDEEHDRVHFKCPIHGKYTVNIATECHRLQFNCQLFNLVIGRFYQDVEFGYIQICGGDYAGFWQEQLLWRHLQKPVLIVYTPLIVDWSGSKLSKSLYLKKDAYRYLKDAGQEYMLSYKVFKEAGKSMDVICDEVDVWLREPFRLFRAYTVHYMHMLFEGKSALQSGTIHLARDAVNRD